MHDIHIQIIRTYEIIDFAQIWNKPMKPIICDVTPNNPNHIHIWIISELKQN